MAGYIGNRAVALSTTAANVTGTITAGALDISGDTDVDGTTNLDVVDIDGAVDMASTLAVGGVVTANAGVVVDNITIDGTEIDLSSGTLTLDSAGDISLQAGSGGERLLISNSTGDVILRTADRYVYSNASSGGTTIDVGLRFESATPKLEFWVNDGERASISSDGSLTVTHDVKLPDSGELVLGADGDLKLYHNNSHAFIKNITGDLNIENNSNIFIDSTHNITLDADGGIVFLKDNGSSYAELENVSSDFVIRVPTQDKNLILRGNDGGSNIDALTLDMQNAGAATFNAGATFGGNVGINQSSPSAKLDVVTNDNVYVAEFTQSNTSNGDGVFIQVGSTASSEYALTVRSDAGNTSVLAAKADGKVGVGVFTPQRHLHVNGGNESTKIQITNQTTGSSSDGDGFQIGIATDGTALLEQRESANMQFYTSNSPRMTIDSNGKVGIGVTSLVNPLEIAVTPNTSTKSTGSVFDAAAVRLNGNLNATSSECAILAGSNDGLSAGIGFMRESSSTWGTAIKFYNHEAATSGTTDDLQEVMRINSDGDLLPFNNVAIGLTSGLPNDAQLTIGNGTPALFFHDTTGGQNNAAISVENGAMKFANGNTGSNVSDQNLRMTLTSDGALQIGDTNGNPTGNHVPQVMLQGAGGSMFHRDDGVAIKVGRNDANECMEFFKQGASQGGISLTSSGVTYNSDSDYRLKENVTYTWDATTRLQQLKPAQFNFISVPDETMNGFLAHEVEAIVPDAVSGTKDAVDDDGNIKAQRIDHSRLVPLLVKALQELSAKNDSLEARIATLEAG